MKQDTLEKFLRNIIPRSSVITNQGTVVFLEDRDNSRMLPLC